MKLTKEQTDNYVADPFHCPHCNSEDIIADEFSFETLEVNVQCSFCNNKWVEIYELKTIKSYEE